MRRQFATYLELLTAWNRTHHLTAYRTPRDIVHGLFIDSLLFLPLLPPRPCRLVDIGTGPGIPSLPLRIVEPGLAVTLVESRRKPVSFLAALERELKLGDFEIFHGRAGEEGETAKGQFDCVVARGVRLAEDLTDTFLGYLRHGGRLVVAAAPAGDFNAPSVPGVRVERITYSRLGLERSFIVLQR